MKIGELAREAGVSVDTIRFYEQQALLPAPPRTHSGYRSYSPEAVRRLTFIRRARELGFRLEEIGELLQLSGSAQADAGQVQQLVAAKVEDLERRIADLVRVKNSLNQLLQDCGGEHMARGDCPILAALTE